MTAMGEKSCENCYWWDAAGQKHNPAWCQGCNRFPPTDLWEPIDSPEISEVEKPRPKVKS